MEDQTVPVSPVIFEAVPFGEEEEAEAEPLVASGKGGADNKTTTTDDLVAKGNTLLCVLDKAASHRRGRKYYCCSCLWNTAQIMVFAWSAFLFVLFFGLHEWDVLKAHNQARQFALDLARKNSTELWDFSQSTFNKLQLEMESKNATEWMEYATQKWQQQVQYVAQQMDEHVEYASSWAAQYLTEAEAALEADVERYVLYF